jgi:hypothetical protein
MADDIKKDPTPADGGTHPLAELALPGGGTYSNRDLEPLSLERIAEVTKEIEAAMAASVVPSWDDLKISLGGKEFPALDIVSIPFERPTRPDSPYGHDGHSLERLTHLHPWRKPEAQRTTHPSPYAPVCEGLGDVYVGPLNVRITMIQKLPGRVRIIGEVNERNTGKPMPLEFVENLYEDDRPMHAHKPMREIIRDAMRAFMLHEIDEQIYEDGERVFDPHREAEPTTLQVTLDHDGYLVRR